MNENISPHGDSILQGKSWKVHSLKAVTGLTLWSKQSPGDAPDLEDGDEHDGDAAWFSWKACDSRVITKQDWERASHHQGVKQDMQAMSRPNKGAQTNSGITMGVYRVWQVTLGMAVLQKMYN